MKKSVLGMIICISVAALYVTLHATRMFKAFLPIENASQYPITLLNNDGQMLATIEASQTSNVRLNAGQVVGIRATLDNQNVTIDATRDALDLSWKIDIDSRTKQINVTKAVQQGGRYDPRQSINPQSNTVPE